MAMMNVQFIKWLAIRLICSFLAQETLKVIASLKTAPSSLYAFDDVMEYYQRLG